MQTVRAESVKSCEVPMPVKTVKNAKSTPHSTGGGQFKELVKKAFGQSAESSQQQPLAATPKIDSSNGAALVDLMAMMADAVAKTAPIVEAGVTAAQPDIEGAQQTQDRPPPGAAQEVLGAITQENGAGAQRPGQHSEKNSGDISGAAATKQALGAKEIAVPKEQGESAKAENPKSSRDVKSQAQTEKPSETKNAQTTPKFIEVKQGEAKEVKQEQAEIPKQQVTAEPEKVYVKVGDGGKIDSEKFASDVADKIFAKLSEGKQQFEIELAPRELGKILIKLVMQNGKAEILIQCLNPKTQQLVMSNADAIRNIVEERTGAHTTVTVKEDEAAHNNDDRGGRQDKHGDQEHHDKKWDEAETHTFIQQLRLGLTEESDT